MGKAIVRYSGSVGGSTAPVAPAGVVSVTLSEVGSRTLKLSDQTTYTTLQAVIEEAISPSGGAPVGTQLHLQFSNDGGTTWYEAGQAVYAADRTDQDGTHTYWVTTINVSGVLVQTAAQSFKARAWSLNQYVDNGPSGAVVSGTCTVGLIGAPSATGATISITSPVAKIDLTTGWQWWEQTITVKTPGSADPNCWAYQVTVQQCNSSGVGGPSGDTNGNERPWFDFANDGNTYSKTIQGTYVAAGSAFTFTNYKVYGFSRSATTAPAWQDPTYSVLQKWPGGGTADLVSFGSIPSGSLDLRRSLPISLHPSLGQDGLGRLQFSISGTGGIGLDGSGVARVQTGSGVTQDSSHSLTLSLGNGLAFSGSSVVPSLGSGLTTSGINIMLNLGNGLTFAGSSLIPNLGAGLQVSGVQITMQLGLGLGFYGTQIQAKLGNGTAVDGGGNITLNLTTGLKWSGAQVAVDISTGLTNSGNSLVVNIGVGLGTSGLQIIIANGGVGPSQISSVNIAQLNAGTMTVGSGGITFSGNGGITVMGGGNVNVSPGLVTGFLVRCSNVVGGPNVGGFQVGAPGSGQLLGIDGQANANFVTMMISGATAINSSNQFVGAGGVACPAGTVGGLMFAVYAGGWAYGATFTFQDLAGATHSVKGGIVLY